MKEININILQVTLIFIFTLFTITTCFIANNKLSNNEIMVENVMDLIKELHQSSPSLPTNTTAPGLDDKGERERVGMTTSSEVSKPVEWEYLWSTTTTPSRDSYYYGLMLITLISLFLNIILLYEKYNAGGTKKYKWATSLSDFLPGPGHKIHNSDKTQVLNNAGVDEKQLTSVCIDSTSQTQTHEEITHGVSPGLDTDVPYLKAPECEQFLYMRLDGAKCDNDKCGLRFKKNDYVMRMKAQSKIYHTHCFRCIACGRQLMVGDEVGFGENGLYCRDDHEVMQNSVEGQHRIISPDSDSSDSERNVLTEESESKNMDGRSGEETRSTPVRVRTILNDKQLHILRTCYAINPRPDALMSDQLAEMTSLSLRVIRVWFQNERCKDKKKAILRKQIREQELEARKLAYLSMDGIPAVTAPPCERPLGYPPGWKAPSDFTTTNLHRDLDSPDPSQPCVWPPRRVSEDVDVEMGGRMFPWQ